MLPLLSLLLLLISIANITTAFDTSECGLSKGCLFKPPGCVPHTNCAYAFSYRSDPNRLYMELLAQVKADSNVFAAVGFSWDDLMGNDTVTECSSFEGAPFSARLSYNPGKSNRKAPINEALHAELLTTHFVSIQEGTLYCMLSQKRVPEESYLNQNSFVRPLDSSYRIFLSSGATTHQQLNVHSLDTSSPNFPYISPEEVNFAEFQHPSVDFSSPPNGLNHAPNNSSLSSSEKAHNAAMDDPVAGPRSSSGGVAEDNEELDHEDDSSSNSTSTTPTTKRPHDPITSPTDEPINDGLTPVRMHGQ